MRKQIPVTVSFRGKELGQAIAESDIMENLVGFRLTGQLSGLLEDAHLSIDEKVTLATEQGSVEGFVAALWYKGQACEAFVTIIPPDGKELDH